MTTLLQLRRIDKVRILMENAIADGTAHKYNHNDYCTCTIGFVVKSNVFKGGLATFNSLGDSLIPLGSGNMRDAVINFFGHDYYDEVANGFSDVEQESPGLPQASRALKLIKKLIRNHPQAHKLDNASATIAVVATDTTKAKIAARVKSLTTIIELTEKLLSEDGDASMVNPDILKSRRDELAILKEYV